MTMYVIPLQNTPNQRCSVRLEGALFEITVKAAISSMAVSIAKDGVVIVRGVRCLPSTPLIPHRHLEGMTGNFYFLTGQNQYPHYSRFGGTDTLCYLTRNELQEIRNG